MNHKISSFFLPFCVMVSVSCEGIHADLPAVSGREPSLVLSPMTNTTPVFTAEGGEAFIRFTADGPWTAELPDSGAGSWLSVTPVSGGSGDTLVTVSATANGTPDERSATVVIRGARDSEVIRVRQQQRNSMTLSTTSFSLPADGGAVRLDVMTNIPFDYFIPDDAREWLSAECETPAEPGGILSVFFSAAPNTMVSGREACVRFSAEGYEQTVTFVQSGAAPAMSLSQREYDIPYFGGLFTVSVQSNVDVTPSVDGTISWIRVIDTKAMPVRDFLFDVGANGSLDAREASVVFLSGAGDIREEVLVRQEAHPEVFLESILLDRSSAVLVEGEVLRLSVTLSPEDVTDRRVVWSSSDTSVADVSAEGEVHALSPGTVTVTAFSASRGMTASCEVTVLPKVIPVTGVLISRSALELYEDEREMLGYIVLPYNATDSEAVWSSSAPEVASVSPSGEVTGHAAGQAVISVTTHDGGHAASCEVTVLPKVVRVIDVRMSDASVDMSAGEELVLSVTFVPSDATDRRLVWTSSDERVVRVSDSGVLHALSKGHAVVTACAVDGGVSATCDVYVR